MTTRASSSDPLSSDDEYHITMEEEVDSLQTLFNHNHSDGDFYKKISELHKAARKGDANKALSLIGKIDGATISTPITDKGQTIIHIATEAKQTRFVEKMLKHIKAEELEQQDGGGNNAFCIAVIAGAEDIARMMLRKNADLLRIQGGGNMTPLFLAVLFGHRKMASFLYDQYQGSEVESKTEIFFASIDNHLFDLALKMLKQDGILAMLHNENDETALRILAQSPYAFGSRGIDLIGHQIGLSTEALELLKCLLEKIRELKGKNFWMYLRENKTLLFDAAKVGNSKFLEMLINFYPDLASELDEDNRTIFHIAVMHRHADILNFINDRVFYKQFIGALSDFEGNNLLHLAATYQDDQTTVNSVLGAALEMQKELLTFKEAALLVLPSHRERKNNEGLTPRQVFTRDHKKLRENGEKWMKDAANSCLLVATIISTVVFAAGFSLPGDYDNKGIPNQLKSTELFSSFCLVNTVALLCSSISTLMFLSILASHYKEEDFFISLPLKLMVGHLTLFISLTSMTLSFSLSFFLAYNQERSKIVPILICTLLITPAIVFVYLQRRPWKHMFQSLFHPMFSFKQIDY